MRNHELGSILDVEMKCPVCDWKGTLGNAELEADDDGVPCCPECLCNLIKIKAKITTRQKEN